MLEDRRLLATLTVTNLGDTGVSGDGSLRGEILAAAAGDTVVFQSGLSGTIHLNSGSGPLVLAKDLTITGPGAAVLTIDGGGAVQDLVVNSGVTAVLSGLTVSGGSASNNGGGIFNRGTLILQDCTISGNTALTGGQGGGIFNGPYGTLHLLNSTISGNTAKKGGGLASVGTTVLTGCTVSGNQAIGNNPSGGYAAGGGIYATSYYGTGSITLTSCTISGNTALASGIYYGNQALGGGIWGSPTMIGCTLSGNTAVATGNNGYNYAHGGGIFGGGTLTNCTLAGNKAIVYGAGPLFNRATGGAIDTHFGSIQLTGCTISGNTAGGSGTGLSGCGGGLYSDNLDGPNYSPSGTTLVNCTVTGNTVDGSFNGYGLTYTSPKPIGGGGLAHNSYYSLTLTNCTISGNTDNTGAGGGGFLDYSGGQFHTPYAAVLNNTIISGNSTTNPANGPDLETNFGAKHAPVVYASHSLFGVLTPGVVLNQDTANLKGTLANPINARLSPLQNNGGPTQTILLLPGSPAIDTGDNTLASAAGLTTDQRGFSRVVNGIVDIGAIESEPVSVTLTGSPNPSLGGQVVTFTATLGRASGSATPTGSVLFMVDGTVLGSAPLTGLTATLTTSTLTVGTHTIMAVYDMAPFSPGQSAPLTQAVTAPPAPPAPPSPPALPPFVSVAFASNQTVFSMPAGPQAVVEVVSSAGVLTQFDATGAHQLATGVRSASVAFGAAGEVLVVVFQDGRLYQFDAAGSHFLAGGIFSASVSFTPGGAQEVLEVVFTDGTLVQFDTAGAHQLATGVRSASVAFGSFGEVMLVTFQDGRLVQFDTAGTHQLASNALAAAVALSPAGQEVLDVIFADRRLFQFDAAGSHFLETL